MISIRCPHCQVGLKVDEAKIPSHIQTFSCPQCKKPIPVSSISIKNKDESETVLLSTPTSDTIHAGKLKTIPNEHTPEQIIQLHEGENIVGRKSSLSDTQTLIETSDKLMSRTHIIIEIKKDVKGMLKHYLFDNKSKNRTLYNGNYIEPGEVIVLKNNDEIQIGQTLLVFEE